VRYNGNVALHRRPGEAAAPWVFAVMTWTLLLLTWATVLVDTALTGSTGVPVRVVAVTLLAAAVAAAWLLLPWTPTSRRSWSLSVVFAALVLLFGYATDMTWAQGLLLVAVANAVFVVGVPRAVASGVCLLPAAWAALAASRAGELSPYEAAYRIGGLAVAGAVVIGLSQVVVAAREDRARADALLAELQERSEHIAELSAAAERARLARDIHDSLGHHLTVAHLQLLNATRARTSPPHAHGPTDDRGDEHADDPAWEHVTAARLTVRTALEEVRRSVRALHPPPPLGSLPDRLHHLASGLDGTAVAVRLDVIGRPRDLSPEVDLLIYRAAQEGLTNAVTHGAASHVELCLDYRPEDVRLSVADDGGDTAPAAPGYGLSNLRARAVDLGGTLGAGPRPGGFRLEVCLPVGSVSASGAPRPAPVTGA
jgi:signal transduction histidine kinase